MVPIGMVPDPDRQEFRKSDMNDTDRMKELVSKLNEAAKAYYAEDREIMSNLEYDRLYDELVAWKKRPELCWQRVRPNRLVMKQ